MSLNDSLAPGYIKVLHKLLLLLWLSHVCACIWYAVGLADELIERDDGGTDALPGWVGASYSAGRNWSAGELDLRMYLLALHAVNPG